MKNLSFLLSTFILFAFASLTNAQVADDFFEPISEDISDIQQTSSALDTITWTGNAGDDKWSTAGNWDLGRVPDSTDFVFIENGNSVLMVDSSYARQ